ncbi:MAG: LapA family protein [Candidatus Latescibacteria bacterium]|nr:LapA family protein [Candidatus Latescibacterota bacterium]
MWILRWVLFALLLIVVVMFASQNAGEMVNIKFLNWESQSSLLAVIGISFVAGLAVWFLFSVFRILQYRSQMRAYQQENKKLKEELTSLKISGSTSPAGEGSDSGATNP